MPGGTVVVTCLGFGPTDPKCDAGSDPSSRTSRYGRAPAPLTGGFTTAFGALVIGGGSISAAHTDAASFAADCNADGTVAVAGVLRVVGGTGVLTTNCIITLDAGEKLVFRGVDLTGPALVVTTSNPSGADTTVKVIDSSIEMSGPLQLSPGAVAGDTEVPDLDATVVVRRSTIRAASIDLSTSLDWARGRVVVVDSNLIVPSGSGSVYISASILGGTDGVARVVNSTIATAGDVIIRSGDAGRTVVRGSAVSGASVAITTGTAGVCRTSGNIPALICS